MELLHFKIIGYYEHCNFGDDQYQTSFVKLLSDCTHSDYTVDFYNCDKIHLYEFSDNDIIILGGGDVLNPYFLNKINKKFKDTPNIIIAFSVGLPYTKTLVQTDLLNIIDYIFLRTNQDLELFEKYFDKNRIFHIPDISYILSNTDKDDIDNDNKIIKQIQNTKKSRNIICVCLSRHIYHPDYKNEYSNVIRNISKCLVTFIRTNYHIVLLPFNTNNDNPKENDILINNDVISNIKVIDPESINHITNIDVALSINDLQNIIKNANVSICMRFHAVLFSLYNNVPTIPVYTTRKIENLLKDTRWDYSYKLPTNNLDIPINLDCTILEDLVKQMTNELPKNIYHELLHINTNCFGKMFSKNIQVFKDIVKEISYGGETKRNVDNNVEEIIKKTYESVIRFCNDHNYDNYWSITDKKLKDIITCIVSYHLIGVTNSDYNWGLGEKMFGNKNYDFNNEWKWIINDWVNKDHEFLPSNPNGLFNINYIDQVDYSGVHRSGWQYVYDHIKYLHNENSDLLLDLYIDRTFHWNRDINKHLGIIPYKQNWFGFIHHTFDTTFSPYNCVKLLECQEFIESLTTCKGLIVLSKYLQITLEKELAKINITNVKVYYIAHPTETNVAKFNLVDFYKNKEKSLLHIGGWLRNIYSFYDSKLPEYMHCKIGFLLGDKFHLPLQYKKYSIKKLALRGKHTNNYYPYQDFTTRLKSILIDEPILDSHNSINTPNCSVTPNCSSSPNLVECDTVITNNWNLDFYKDTCAKINSVNFIDYLSNMDYDTLITRNIVYINLVDASAVNTVIECIIRYTPIIVNKHPAIVELLGEKYPLYLKESTSSTYNLQELLCSDKLIRRAHYYLKKLKVEKFSISTYLTNFQGILKNIKHI